MNGLFVVTVTAGEEVIAKVTEVLQEKGVTSAAIVSVIGACESCCILNMPAHDASLDTKNEYYEPLELSGNGEVLDGIPHIHCVASRENEETLAGHLHWAKPETWWIKVFILPMGDG